MDSSVKSETKSEEDYLEIIDKLTREMFDYSQEPPVRQKSLSNMTRSESEYERVMRELDIKLEIQQREDRGSRPGTVVTVTPTPRTRDRRETGPSLETIDSVFGPPDKITIPERYQPHLDMESEDEEHKDEKALDIR